MHGPSDQVIRMGARWIGYSHKLDQFLQDYQPSDRHPFYMLMEYMLLYDEVVLPEILDVMKEDRFDVIICDSFFGGACFLKQMTRIPVVSSHSSFAMSHAPVPPRMLVPGFHPQLDHCYQILQRICQNHQIEPPSLEAVFIGKSNLNIVYTTRSLNGDEEVHEPDYLFCGPSIDRRQEECNLDLSTSGSRTDARKLVYISLGSVNTDFLDFYRVCISAFRNTDYVVCMSIGTKCDVAQLGAIPDNFLVRRFLPQLEILKQADGFITHAGFNSVNEALYYGVPMLDVPQVNDQHRVAKRLVAMRLGMAEDMKSLTPEILKSKMDDLVLNKEIKENCQRISQEMRTSAQMDQTVMELEKYAGTEKGGD